MGEQHILGPRLFALGTGDVWDLRNAGETVLFEKRRVRSEKRRVAAVESDEEDDSNRSGEYNLKLRRAGLKKPALFLFPPLCILDNISSTGR